MNAFGPFIPFIAAAAVAALSVPPLRRFAKARGLVDRPRADRVHDRPVPLLGGVGCLAGLIAAVAAWEIFRRARGLPEAIPARFAVAAAIGLLGMAAIGLRDDRRPLAPLPKGALEGLVLALVLVVWRPDGLLGGLLPGIGAWVAAMLLVNAWNYLDHADGTFASGLGVAAVALALAWSSRVAETGALGALWGLGGVAVGFLIWNLPPAQIFLGDAGSLPLGFLAVFASLALVDRASPAAIPIAIASQALRLADLMLVSAARLRSGRNPLRGGREHSGHRLGRAVGPLGAPMAIAGASAAFGAAGLYWGTDDPRRTALYIGLGAILLAFVLGRFPPPEPAPATDPGSRRPRRRVD